MGEKNKVIFQTLHFTDCLETVYTGENMLSLDLRYDSGIAATAHRMNARAGSLTRSRRRRL